MDDPGGNFASDEHRRVMSALANPDEAHLSVDELEARIGKDDYLDLSPAELDDILQDLEADGDATQKGGGWKNTKAGFKVLNGPISEDGGRQHGA